MVDDLGKEWVNCYGGENIETPNIDALAAKGIKFNNAYSMPQCTPNRASPRYDPLPPQSWDVNQKNPGRRSGRKGLPSHQRKKRK